MVFQSVPAFFSASGFERDNIDDGYRLILIKPFAQFQRDAVYALCSKEIMWRLHRSGIKGTVVIDERNMVVVHSHSLKQFFQSLSGAMRGFLGDLANDHDGS